MQYIYRGLWGALLSVRELFSGYLINCKTLDEKSEPRQLELK